MKWFTIEERRPDPGQYCLLIGKHTGPASASVYGPIMWHEQSGSWLDLFATPEAGEMITPGEVGKWLPWDLVKPDE